MESLVAGGMCVFLLGSMSSLTPSSFDRSVTTCSTR